MRVIYTKTITEKIREAHLQASSVNKTVEAIELTKAEAIQLLEEVDREQLGSFKERVDLRNKVYQKYLRDKYLFTYYGIRLVLEEDEF